MTTSAVSNFSHACKAFLLKKDVAGLARSLPSNFSSIEASDIHTVARLLVAIHNEHIDESFYRMVLFKLLYALSQKLNLNDNLFRTIQFDEALHDKQYAVNLLGILNPEAQTNFSEDKYLFNSFYYFYLKKRLPEMMTLLRYALYQNKNNVLIKIFKSKVDPYTWRNLLLSSALSDSFKDKQKLFALMLQANFSLLFIYEDWLLTFSLQERAQFFRNPVIEGKTLFEIAIENRQYHTVRYLLQSPHFNVQWAYQKNNQGENIIDLAVRLKDYKMLMILKRFGGLDIELGVAQKVKLAMQVYLNKALNIISRAKIRSLCLKGGGMKGISVPAALIEGENLGLFKLSDIEVFTGTSAGGVSAFLLAIGFSLEQLSYILSHEINYSELLDVEEGLDVEYYLKLFSGESGDWSIWKGFDVALNILRDGQGIVKTKGLFKTGVIRNYFVKKLNATLRGTEYEGQAAQLTYADYAWLMEKYPDRFKEFRVVSWCTELEEIIYFSASDQHSQDINVISTILATMAIPGVFESQVFKYKGRLHTFIDGGVGQNYPFSLARKGFNNNEVLGFYFQEDYNKEKIKIQALEKAFNPNLVKADIGSFLEHVFRSAKSNFYVQNATHLKNKDEVMQTVYIDTGEVTATEFKLDHTRKSALEISGINGILNYYSRYLRFSLNRISTSVLKLFNLLLPENGFYIQNTELVAKKLFELELSADQIFNIYRVASESDLPYLRILLNPNPRLSGHLTALHIAYAYDDQITINKLLASGANSARTATLEDQKSYRPSELKGRKDLIRMDGLHTSSSQLSNEQENMYQLIIRALAEDNHRLKQSLNSKPEVPKWYSPMGDQDSSRKRVIIEQQRLPERPHSYRQLLGLTLIGLSFLVCLTLLVIATMAAIMGSGISMALIAYGGFFLFSGLLSAAMGLHMNLRQPALFISNNQYVAAHDTHLVADSPSIEQPFIGADTPNSAMLASDIEDLQSDLYIQSKFTK